MNWVDHAVSYSTMVNRLDASLSAASSSIAKIFHHTITSSERRMVNQFLIDAERALNEYEIDIKKHKAAIIALEGKHSQLKKKADKYRSLLSPVHRIPPEVLARIFHACRNHGPLTSQPTLMTITEVCRRWRDVALSAPYLWSSFISFDFNEWIYHHDTFEPLDRIIPLLLMRTQACPLDIHLNFAYLKDEQMSTCIASCKDVFAASHRWRHATIGITPRSYHQPAFEAIRGQLPQLRSLDLTLGDWVTAAESFGHLDIFRDCPSLHSFKLRIHEQFRHSPDNILLPYPQLRNVAFDAFNIQNLLPCLSTAFSHAVHLDIEDFVPSSTTGESHALLGSVQHLKLTTKWQDQSSFIFGLATLPHLLTLEVNGASTLSLESRPILPNLWRTFDEKLVVEFIKRSACDLTSLTLKSIPATDFQTITLLRLMPTLTHLHIEEVDQVYNANVKDFNNRILTTTFFHHLMIDDENASDTCIPPFLPRLTELVFTASRLGLDQNALLDAITSRYQHDSGNGFASLRSLSLTVFCRGREPELPPLRCFSSLKCFQATGLLLKLTPDDWEA
ncbi:hypothetical protein VNI00_008932 [Paramarasmius palmivorus]|uniref:F-box domain-containing protein n=1 Tax=Paramarasmius palmivorus TaxID=297713 RepID=A0AAW0CT07_9AGAR